MEACQPVVERISKNSLYPKSNEIYTSVSQFEKDSKRKFMKKLGKKSVLMDVNDSIDQFC
jgi:hypothetical protein